jgi:hypothetical protein
MLEVEWSYDTVDVCSEVIPYTHIMIYTYMIYDIIDTRTIAYRLPKVC